MKSYVFRVQLIEETEDGGWSALVPLLPGCAVSGDTVEEALKYLREAAQAYVEVLLEEGDPVPTERMESGPVVFDGPVVAVVAGKTTPVG